MNFEPKLLNRHFRWEHWIRERRYHFGLKTTCMKKYTKPCGSITTSFSSLWTFLMLAPLHYQGLKLLLQEIITWKDLVFERHRWPDCIGSCEIQIVLLGVVSLVWDEGVYQVVLILVKLAKSRWTDRTFGECKLSEQVVAHRYATF